MNAISQFPAVASGPSLDNRRIAAGAVDLALVVVVGLLLRTLAGGEFTPLLGLLTVGWALLYYFACESAGGQTLGKRLLGLRVQRVGGGAADERAIALRTVLRVVDGIGFYLVGLVVMMRTGQRRQRLGDIVGGTEVVDARAGSFEPAAVKASDAAAVAPEAGEAYVPSLGVEAEPHRAELPSQLFELDRDEEVAPEPVEDEGARVEIVSSDEDAAPEPEPEPELPRAEAEEPEPEEHTAAEPGAEREPELELPRAEADEPEPEPEPEPTAAEPEPEEPEVEPSAAEADSALPRVSSHALEELADDVAATASKPSRRDTEQEAPADADAPAEEAPAEESITVKPVETVSPMDLVMDQSEDEPEPAGKGSRSRSRTRGGTS